MKTTTQQREHLEALIGRAEQEAKRRPRRYRAKVGLLALLGYLVIFGMLFTLVAISVGIGWAALASTTFAILLLKKKLIVVILAMIYVLLRALWVKFEPPTGYRLTAKHYPKLFERLKTLSRQLRAPRIHQVILTPEYNAAIVQTPRLGVFGFPKNTLFLGLELLLSLSPAQAEAVIAHELGHLSAAHSRFAGWIYRVRLSWQRIVAGLERQQNIGASLMRRFFDWYAPTFAAYSFALARTNEFAADAVAAQLTSRHDAAQALVNTYVVSGLVNEHFWTPFLKQADTSELPTAPFKPLCDFLRQPPFETADLHAKVAEALKVATGHYDTHPALTDRLQALKTEAPLPKMPADSAARAWLGGELDRVLADFDADWLKNNDDKWRERYRYCQEGRQTLAELSQQASETLSAAQHWQLAVLTEEFAPDIDPLPLFQSYRAAHADADADFVIGRLLLKRDDSAGIAAIEAAIAAKPELTLEGCRWLDYFYRRRGDEAAADDCLKRAERQMDINRAAGLERDTLTRKDRFVKPRADEATLAAIRAAAAEVAGVKRVWLAEKPMQHYPEAKTYAVVFAKSAFANEKKLTRQLLERLSLPHTLFVLAKSGSHAAIAKRAIKAGSEIYRR
ncbi:M48 family metallopeptidase [Methylomonas sp. UP202]|uniref:M48 family metallopeptidase n=1 Tax=Methylomonas sp. UP202 TaxID=3040943 RepID=UPI0024792A19|nr:M48 family metallopeptidase [Methylomonas sp. UP202]WGS85960.1 M48 family metallopeptidase [Methylomonas sp. UP202]